MKKKIKKNVNIKKISQDLFFKKVFILCKKIPFGKVSTYKEIAKAINKPKNFRLVGKALSYSIGMPYIPCHRVVYNNGKIGGFRFGLKRKVALLKKEGIKIKNNKIQNFSKVLFKFN
jgi:methylated-DNA-[protein]-cysteine S-methyltransferase